MKKNLLAIVGFLSLTPFVHAQENTHKNGFGIKAGLNMSTVHTQNDTPLPFEKDADYKPGYHVGIYAEIFVNEDQKIALQPEIFYSQDGYKIKDFNGNRVNGELEYCLRSFNIPILVKYYFTKNFNIFVGPQVVYQESQKYMIGDDEVNIANQGYSRRINSTNLNVASGLELSSLSGFSINARYIHGTHTLYKTRDEQNITHRGFQIGLGYKF